MISTRTAYQWQSSLDKTTWEDIPENKGGTAESYVAPGDFNYNGFYRCVTTVSLLDLNSTYTTTTPAYKGGTVSRTLYAAKSCIGGLLNSPPSQFQDKPNILAILTAYAHKRDELTKLFEDLNLITDVETAVGQNLDYVGSIVSMTRTEAFQAMNAPAGTVMDDETYRNCLRYKVIANNTDGVYADIMKGIDLLWPGVKVKYSEPANRDAAFMITLDTVNIDDGDPAANAPLIIRAGGVQLILDTSYLHVMDLTDQEVFTDELISFNAYVYFDGTFTFNGDKSFQAEAEVVPL